MSPRARSHAAWTERTISGQVGIRRLGTTARSAGRSGSGPRCRRPPHARWPGAWWCRPGRTRSPGSRAGRSARRRCRPRCSAPAAGPVSASMLAASSSLSAPGAVTKASALPSTLELVIGCQRRDLRRAASASRLSRRVAVVEADVEAGGGLAGDDVGGGVADVDRGHLQVRGLEPVGALVERRRDQVRAARRPAGGRRCRRAAGRRCGPAGRAR